LGFLLWGGVVVCLGVLGFWGGWVASWGGWWFCWGLGRCFSLCFFWGWVFFFGGEFVLGVWGCGGGWVFGGVLGARGWLTGVFCGLVFFGVGGFGWVVGFSILYVPFFEVGDSALFLERTLKHKQKPNDKTQNPFFVFASFTIGNRPFLGGLVRERSFRADPFLSFYLQTSRHALHLPCNFSFG